MTYKAHIEYIEKQTGKAPENFLALAKKKGFVKNGEMVAKHGEVLAWLKKEMKLGHGHANAIILYQKSPEMAKKKIERGE